MVKATAEQKPQSDKAKESGRGLTLMKLSLPPVVLVVLIVLLSGYVAYLQYALLVHKAQRDRQAAVAGRLAALIGGRVAALDDRVTARAEAGPELAAAIVAQDDEGLRQYEQSLQALLPEAIRIRVVLPSDTDPDASLQPPLSYACLDLARQAESGKKPPLEMHLYGTVSAHLDLVRPIREVNRVLGSLVVSFDPSLPAAWLKGVATGGGFVELRQGTEGTVLGSLGNAGMKRGEPAYLAAVPGSGWRLAYWADDESGMAEEQKLHFLAIFGGAALVIALLMLLYARFVSATIKRELEGVAQFMVESHRGKRFHSYPVKMAEMERALQAMEPVLHQVKHNDGLKKKAEQGDSGVPDMMFMDFGEIAVEEGETPPEQGSEPK